MGGRRARGLAATRVIRAFRRLGFEVDHVTGSHYIMIHSDGRRVSIPRHQRVKTGLLLGQAEKAQHHVGGIQGLPLGERSYLIIVHPEPEGGYWTEVPSLPGCGSQGDSIDEAVEMTKDAIQGFLESMQRHGQTPPEETAFAVIVTVAA